MQPLRLEADASASRLDDAVIERIDSRPLVAKNKKKKIPGFAATLTRTDSS